MGGLDGVGETFGEEDGLIEFEAVGVDVVAGGCVAVGGGAAVDGGCNPAIYFAAAGGSVDGGHEGVGGGVGLADDRGAAVAPVGFGKGGGVERGRLAATGWGGGCGCGAEPVLMVGLGEAGEEGAGERSWFRGDGCGWGGGRRSGNGRLLCGCGAG